MILIIDLHVRFDIIELQRHRMIYILDITVLVILKLLFVRIKILAFFSLIICSYCLLIPIKSPKNNIVSPTISLASHSNSLLIISRRRLSNHFRSSSFTKRSLNTRTFSWYQSSSNFFRCWKRFNEITIEWNETI